MDAVVLIALGRRSRLRKSLIFTPARFSTSENEKNAIAVVIASRGCEMMRTIGFNTGEAHSRARPSQVSFGCTSAVAIAGSIALVRAMMLWNRFAGGSTATNDF